MSIPNAGQRKIRPTHPGTMLREDFLFDYGLTVSGLAEALGVSRQTMNELLRGRRAVSPEMALRLSRLFGNSPEFWLNAQRAVDLWYAARAIKTQVERIKPLKVAGARACSGSAIQGSHTREVGGSSQGPRAPAALCRRRGGARRLTRARVRRSG